MVPPDDYLILGLDPGPAPEGTLFGSQEPQVLCGQTDVETIREIVDARGNIWPAKTTVRTGSELQMIEPEYVEWTEAQELYPLVFDTLGDWSVTIGLVPPEGFVADYAFLSADVTTETEAVQFTLTDVGSSWIPTRAWHRVTHGGRNEVILSRIGVRLSDALAQAKGVTTEGYVLDVNGQIVLEPGFDPRADRPVQLSGWIERSSVDANWTVKLRVNQGTDLKLTLVNSKGTVVKTLASGYLREGEHGIVWDSRDSNGKRLGRDQYYLKLVAGTLLEQVGFLNIAPF